MNEAQRQKALDIAQSVIDTALSIYGIYDSPIKNSHLLKKRVFPDRKIQHRKKRMMKKQAKCEMAVRMSIVAMQAAFGASRVAAIQSRPISNQLPTSLPFTTKK